MACQCLENFVQLEIRHEPRSEYLTRYSSPVKALMTLIAPVLPPMHNRGAPVSTSLVHAHTKLFASGLSEVRRTVYQPCAEEPYIFIFDR